MLMEEGQESEYQGFHRVPQPMRVEKADKPLRLLFLYSRLPLPMTRGDELTVSHLLEYFHSRGHKVDFITLGQKTKLRQQHLNWLERHTSKLAIIPHHLVLQAPKALLGWLKGKPLQIGLFDSAVQKNLAAEWADQEDYDVVYAYYIRSAEALHDIKEKGRLSVLALQLSQTLNTERLAKTARTWIERLFYKLESQRMAAYEAKIWQGTGKTVLIGQKDLEAIEKVCRENNEPLINNHIFGPHGVDVEQFKPRDPDESEEHTIVMSGVMSYAPNVEAALWFFKEVWPLVRQQTPDARFYLVGRNPVPALKAYDGQDGIKVTGTVEDPGDWIARAHLCVAPIRAAAGLQNKLLEAMAMGKPVIATHVANEGINAQEGRDVLLADEPEEMAQKISLLFHDAEACSKLGRHARAFIEEHWTWEGPFLRLEAEWHQALEKKG